MGLVWFSPDKYLEYMYVHMYKGRTPALQLTLISALGRGSQLLLLLGEYYELN